MMLCVSTKPFLIPFFVTLSPGLINDNLFNYVGYVFGNDRIILLTKSEV